jgi:hypothetical protein
MGDYISTEMGFLGDAIVGLPYWQALIVLAAIILAGLVAWAMSWKGRCGLCTLLYGRAVDEIEAGQALEAVAQAKRQRGIWIYEVSRNVLHAAGLV